MWREESLTGINLATRSQWSIIAPSQIEAGTPPDFRFFRLSAAHSPRACSVRYVEGQPRPPRNSEDEEAVVGHCERKHGSRFTTEEDQFKLKASFILLRVA